MDRFQKDLVDITTEILQITKQNNELLIKISNYIDRVQSNEYIISEDQKRIVMNMIANMLSGFKHF